MHFRKLSSVTAIFFTSALFIGACGEGDPEIEEPVGVIESSLQACGTGLYCSLSPQHAPGAQPSVRLEISRPCRDDAHWMHSPDKA